MEEIRMMDLLGELNAEPQEVFQYDGELQKLMKKASATDALIGYFLSFTAEKGLKAQLGRGNTILITREASDEATEKPALLLTANLSKGTIGVAVILALLSDASSSYPRIEAILSADLRRSAGTEDAELMNRVQAIRCINLDYRGEGMVLRSAGGLRVETAFPIKRRDFAGAVACKLSVEGLRDCSIDDSSCAGGNALMILGRVLYELFHTAPLRLVSINREPRRNQIPGTAEATFVTNLKGIPRMTDTMEQLQEILSKEYEDREKNLSIHLTVIDRAEKDEENASSIPKSQKVASPAGDSFWKKAEKRQVVMRTNTVVSAGTQLPEEHDVRIYHRAGSGKEFPLDEKSTRNVLNFFMCVPRDVITEGVLSQGIPEVFSVTTSAEIRRSEFHASTQIRSFRETRKYFLAERMETLAQMLGGDVMTDDNYRAWETAESSELARVFAEAYERASGGSISSASTLERLAGAGAGCGVDGKEMACLAVGPVPASNGLMKGSSDAHAVRVIFDALKDMLRNS